MRSTRRPFGDWVDSQIHPLNITVTELSDYSGIHIRTLYRILNGKTVLRFEDWIWIVECVSDMTGQNLTDCVMSAVMHMLLNR